MKVKCIHPFMGLVLGQVYETREKRFWYGKAFYALKDIEGGWYADRFEIIEEPQVSFGVVPVPIVIVPAANQHNPNAECPCKIGITYSQCQYHK